MKSVMIIENNTNKLELLENVNAGVARKNYILAGPFTDFDILNRNQRIYTAPKFLPCLNEMNERMSMGPVYGEYDHPDVFDTHMQRVSHMVNKAVYDKANNRVSGEIKLTPGHYGKEARAMVDEGFPLFISSRAAGVTENDGSVTLKKLFTYDIVADPGFATAKLTPINEKLNYTTESNFRIYEMSDESKINELFKMNKKEQVTQGQMAAYSKYLINEIASTKKAIVDATKKGNVDPKKIEKLLEYYDTVNSDHSHITKYIDYMGKKLNYVIKENAKLKDKTERLIEHNDYLSTTLEKTIDYVKYSTNEVDKLIGYSEVLAGKIDETIDYAQNTAKVVNENHKTVSKLVKYSKYIAEKLDRNICWGEHIAEYLEHTIAYTENLFEHVEATTIYTNYIAEHLDDTIGYGEHLANNLDKNITLSGIIVEKLNKSKINENFGGLIPTLEEMGFENEEEIVDAPGEEVVNFNTTDITEVNPMQQSAPVMPEQNAGNVQTVTTETPAGDKTVTTITITTEAPAVETPVVEPINEAPEDAPAPVTEEPIENNDELDESVLSKQIDSLISEAKKRKITESTDLHFFNFLTKTQIDAFYKLTNEEQENVKVHMNGKSYYSTNDVLKLVNEALSVSNELLEDKVIRLMPDNVKPVWMSMNESSKKSIVSQIKLHGATLTNEQTIENFWNTRKLPKTETTKVLVSQDSLIREDKISDNEMKMIMERFKSLN